MRQISEPGAQENRLTFTSFLLLFFLIAAGTSYAFDLQHVARGMKPFMSSDGRFVAFIGSNLIAASGEVNQLYLYDRDLDTLELISQDATGASANADVNLPQNVGQRAVTDDGRYVVFQTSATNLPGDSTAGLRHIYVRNRDTGTTTLISKSSAGDPANFTNVNGEFSIAPNGWAVLFNSTANNLDPLDTDNNANTFLYQLNDGPSLPPPTTNLACYDRDGSKINGCSKVSLACTGTMAFVSGSDTVVSSLEDTHTGNDVFYGIPLNGSNTIISVGPSGEPADDISFSAPSISCDGNRIAFATKASLTLDDTDADWDLYAHDLSTGVSALLRGPADTPLRSDEATMSPNGIWIAFRTKAALDAIDNNGAFVNDIYALFYSRDRLVLGAPRLASQESGVVGNTLSVFPAIGNNGGVGFQSGSSNFTPVDANIDVFVNGCTPSVLALNGDPVSDTQNFEACEIFAENKMVLQPLGDLTLKAHRIILGSGFSVQADASLTLENL